MNPITVNHTITTREMFSAAVAMLIANTDFTSVGQLKPHVAKKDGEQVKDADGNAIVTGMYFSVEEPRLPGTYAVTFDGEKFYSKHLSFNLRAFNLADSEFATATKTASATPATISATDLKAKIAQARETAASIAKPKPGQVVAAPATPR